MSLISTNPANSPEPGNAHSADDWTLSAPAGAALWWLRGYAPPYGLSAGPANDQRCQTPRVNEAVDIPHGTLLHLEPTAWLMVVESAHADAEAQSPRQAVADRAYALDVSGAYRVLRLEGRGVTRVLAQGCALDLGAAAFPVGRCTRTRFAEVPLILHRTGELAFTAYCPRSYAEYLWQVLSNEFRPLD